LPPHQLFESFCHEDGCFFLDSGMVSEAIGRYSILGRDPFMTLRSKGRKTEIFREGAVERMDGNPFAKLAELLRRHERPPANDGLPFHSGAVGFFSYDLCHFVERLPDTTIDDILFPDLYLAFYDRAIVYDHIAGKCWAVAEGESREETETKTRALVSKIQNLEHGASRDTKSKIQNSVAASRPSPLATNFQKEEYIAAIRQAKEYIAAGDIFQVNLSQRFTAEIGIDSYELYRRLRRINPAPFAAYLRFGENAVVSASPERFLRVQGRHVQTRPIKGTRPRGKDPATDEAMRRELLASAKDAAELAMIIDLERNDLGRVCSYGTVKVTQRKVLEEYPTVYHLVGTVEGDIHPRFGLVDLIKACFPGGSITGAPKIRAMQIIDELEPTKRSLYTGAIGYIDFGGTTDLNIVIRTFLVRGRQAFFQAGGGIVADSDPESEYEETLDKARALMEAVQGQDVKG
jgi:para-aminobenzoate synthetase component 1